MEEDSVEAEEERIAQQIEEDTGIDIRISN
jgi:hypothetical protein